MSTELCGVALRLHGPLQAWGGPVIGDTRPTLAFPTRSGVLGLIAGCLGIRRDEQARLLALADGARVHVRVDAAGSPLVDDQTIQGHPGASTTRQTIQSKRTYLCDASFAVVVVPGDQVTTTALARALREPVFAPFLGRRACVPSSQLLLKDEVRAPEPTALFDDLERGPAELLPKPPASFTDFYLDAHPHPDAVRHFPIRDDFAGPLPRQWRERLVFHVRKSNQSAR